MYVTSYLDKSVLYGYSDELAIKLRTLNDGLLKTNRYGNFPEYPDCEYNDWRCFMMGKIMPSKKCLTNADNYILLIYRKCTTNRYAINGNTIKFTFSQLFGHRTEAYQSALE